MVYPFQFLSSLFFTKRFFIAILFLLIQQMIVAGSIYALIYALHEISLPTKSIFIYIFLIASPYVPAIISHYQFQLWELYVLEKTQKKIIDILRSQSFVWCHHEKSTLLTAAFSKEIPILISSIVSATSSFLSVLISIFFIIFVTSMFVPFYLIVSIFIGFFLSIVFSFYGYSCQNSIIQNEQEEKLKSTCLNNLVWDNMTIGNNYNQILWLRHFDAQFQIMKKASIKAYLYYSQFTLFATLLSMLPFMICFFLSFQYSTVDLVWVVILPRIFNLFNSFNNLIASIYDYKIILLKFRQVFLLFKIEDIEKQSAEKNIVKRIKEITILNTENDKVIDFKVFLEQIISSKIINGRYRVLGTNGSGKSSFLRLIKLRMQDHAFHLPFKHELIFSNLYKASSTGEERCKVLRETLNLDVLIFLLDEWNANLDLNNKMQLNYIIEDLSKNKLVVEVIH